MLHDRSSTSRNVWSLAHGKCLEQPCGAPSHGSPIDPKATNYAPCSALQKSREALYEDPPPAGEREEQSQAYSAASLLLGLLIQALKVAPAKKPGQPSNRLSLAFVWQGKPTASRDGQQTQSSQRASQRGRCPRTRTMTSAVQLASPRQASLRLFFWNSDSMACTTSFQMGQNQTTNKTAGFSH